MWKTSGPSFRDIEVLIWCTHGDVGNLFFFFFFAYRVSSFEKLIWKSWAAQSSLVCCEHTRKQTKSSLIGLGQLFWSRFTNQWDCLLTPDGPGLMSAEGRDHHPLFSLGAVGRVHVCQPPSTQPPPTQPPSRLVLDNLLLWNRLCSVRVVAGGFPSHWIIGNN